MRQMMDHYDRISTDDSCEKRNCAHPSNPPTDLRFPIPLADLTAPSNCCCCITSPIAVGLISAYAYRLDPIPPVPIPIPIPIDIPWSVAFPSPAGVPVGDTPAAAAYRNAVSLRGRSRCGGCSGARSLLRTSDVEFGSSSSIPTSGSVPLEGPAIALFREMIGGTPVGFLCLLMLFRPLFQAAGSPLDGYVHRVMCRGCRAKKKKEERDSSVCRYWIVVSIRCIFLKRARRQYRSRIHFRFPAVYSPRPVSEVDDELYFLS